MSYLLFLQNIREALGGVFDSLMLQMTVFGEGVITYLLLAVIYWCWDKRSGQYMGLNVALACTMNQFLKAVLRIDRPWIRDERIRPVKAAVPGAGGYSFPSGHTQRAAAVWGGLGVSLWKQKERAVSAICWTILALIAFSRNYLGVHTPQDVLFALASGAVLLFVTDKVLLWADGGRNRDVIAAAAGCALCFLPMLKVGCLSNAGAGMGFLIGWVVERHFIKFRTEDVWSCKVVRLAVGCAGILFILKVLPAVLGLVMESKYAGFFTSFSLAVFIMAVYPFFFCRKERYRAGIVALLVVVLGITAFSFACQSDRSKAVSQETEPEMKETQQSEEQPSGLNEEGGDSGTWEGTETAAVLQPPKIIAHRGYSSVFPENTMAAFAGALDIGADYIELDVQLTADGIVVVSHDDTLLRTTGVDSRISELTYEELSQLDAGSWFDAAYTGEKVPTLREVMELVKDTDCNIYLELKDIGAVPGFEEAVLEVADQCGMTDRCLFASFQYDYLKHFKELNPELMTLYNTTSGKSTLTGEFPAEYYGMYIETVTSESVNAIHEAGSQVFVWTVNTPAQIQNMIACGVDGIVTNYPGMAKVMRRSEYVYLAENYEKSITMPGLYGPELPEQCGDMIVQGFTKIGNKNMLAVSAYSKSGEYNSILYVMNMDGKLTKTVDLGFKAHTGGIAYDEEHDLLWITGPEGKVYAVRWSSILDDTYQGEIQISFDAGLVNHNGTKVASFLTFFEGSLFVGSYVDGSGGVLNRYDLSDVQNPAFVSAVTIPERIQGVTFRRDARDGNCYMLLSQSYRTEDSRLMKFIYEEETEDYEEPEESHVLPEGAEQIQMSADGLYILFESAARPYRATARIPNDQIYVLRQ